MAEIEQCSYPVVAFCTEKAGVLQTFAHLLCLFLGLRKLPPPPPHKTPLDFRGGAMQMSSGEELITLPGLPTSGQRGVQIQPTLQRWSQLACPFKTHSPGGAAGLQDPAPNTDQGRVLKNDRCCLPVGPPTPSSFFLALSRGGNLGPLDRLVPLQCLLWRGGAAAQPTLSRAGLPGSVLAKQDLQHARLSR